MPSSLQSMVVCVEIVVKRQYKATNIYKLHPLACHASWSFIIGSIEKSKCNNIPIVLPTDFRRHYILTVTSAFNVLLQ
jgi:hypothetical protein